MKNSVCLKRILAILVFGCHALFAQAVTFYFLPPDNDNWVSGNSYLYDGDKKTVELMQVDTRCGWFKKTFASRNDVPDSVLIYLGSQGRDKLDMKGTGADPDSDPAWINLKTRFGGTNTSLYYYQDLSSGDSDFRFRTTAPGNLGEEAAGRCSYKMAAFIYDTDSTVNPSFSGRYFALTAGNESIRRGIVAPTLDTTTRKPAFIARDGYANWRNAASFNAAFTPEGEYNGKVSNVPRCYDMPFGRSTNGTWEFDSDNMRPPNPAGTTNLVGGFFPYILDSAYSKDPDGSDADYSKCPTCRREYTVACFNRLGGTTLNNLAPVTWRDSTYTGAAAFDRTYFRDGTALGGYYGGAAGCNTARPGFDGASKGRANLSFCFESHAEFIYEKGQEFFFRGDDDIWVFINNQLVIDLGGVHNAAPGYVDLDTIKTPTRLEAGKKYPIDIFFCERMATQSNVRVSTNMYIVQKSTFYDNPEKLDNWMCANISSGNDCASKMNATSPSSQVNLCGDALIDDGTYSVDFYMVKRGLEQDTIWLSGTKNRTNCQGSATEFTCFAKDGVAGSGITVNKAVYSCGGRGKCKSSQEALNKVEVPTGNYTVYARLVDSRTGKPISGSKPLNIDNIKSATNARIVWGELHSEHGNILDLDDAYERKTTREQSVIAEKPTPIYIAAGQWTDTKYKSFNYIELDPTDIPPEYSLSGTEGLKVTSDELGEVEADFPRQLPLSGIDTLWVKGDFSMGEKEFSINLAGISVSAETPSLKLTIYQPELRFTDSAFTTPNFITPSGYSRWITPPDTLPPLVDKSLDVYVVAWDSVEREICSHCNFSLRETSTTNNDSINRIWQNAIVQSPSTDRVIKNGKGTIFMRGRDVVEKTDFAKWKIYGLSPDYTYAEWTKLQFRKAPIPMPLESFVYDRNGDGVGDSLVIKFSKSFFKSKDVLNDSLLPILIEVTWEQGYTVAFHSPKYNLDDLKKREYVMNLYKTKSFFDDNREYWKNYLNSDTVTMIIAEPNTAFSRNILTVGKGNIISHTPFIDLGKCTGATCKDDAFTYTGYEASVLDRIPPIVVRAEYAMDTKSKNCGSDKNHSCRESLVAYLSESIYAAPNANDDPLLVKNPFSYCFEYSQNSKCAKGENINRHDQSVNTTKWQWELPQEKNQEDTSHLVTYKPNSKRAFPKDYYDGVNKGDSIVDLTYYAYNIGDEKTRMPKAEDWIKIRWPVASSKNGGVDVFYDAEGNTANPREIGVRISGSNYYRKEQVKTADIVAHPDSAVLHGLFSDRSTKPCPPSTRGEPCAYWLSDIAKDYADGNLFQPGDVAAFLPIPSNNYPIDRVKVDYKGSVGTVFLISNDINTRVGNIMKECTDENGNIICSNSKGQPLSTDNIAEGITLHASVYYHTNLGNYTAHRNPVKANCTDKIFQKKDGPNNSSNNCYSNAYNFYLAWDLKTNKNRFVGSGAYVAITKFYFQIEYIDANKDTKKLKFDQDEFVEMYGVRRSK